MKKITLLFLFLMGSIATSFAQISEDFEGAWPPAGWTIQSTNTTYTWEEVDPGINGKSAFVDWDVDQDESLISPAFNVPSGSPVLEFTMAMGYEYGVDPDDNYDFIVSISTDGGTTWTPIWNENELGFFFDYDFIDVEVPLSAYAGQTGAKLRFQYVGSDGDILAVDDIHVDIPPAAAPDCATLNEPADVATGIEYWEPVTLSWTAPAAGESVASYDVYLDTNASPTTLLGNVTELTMDVEELAASTTYYWKVVAKNAAGEATGCSVFSFTTAANPFAPYCGGPIVFTENTEPITLVNFADINNATSATLNGTPDHEDFRSIVGHVTAGSSYTITLKGNTDGASYTNRFMVYADWNQDGDFADANEAYTITQTITGSTGNDAVQATQSLLVPPTALAGNTRMRVKKIYGTVNYADPCLGTTYGQAEEYTLAVTAAPADAPDYANLQWPYTATIAMGETVTVYGQVYEAGLTDVEPGLSGQAAGITAWVGYNTADTNPNTWTNWIPATWNSSQSNNPNNDEYQAALGTGLTPGTYYYATRFQLNGGAFVYGGTNDGFWDGTAHINGVLTVNAPPPVTPNCDLVSSLPDDSLGGSVWDRPLANGSGMSATGVDVSYHIYGPFVVDTAGSYTFNSTQDFDGYIFVYQNSFDPSAPLTGYLAGNDDGGPGSTITTNLTTGTTYYFITTAYEPGEFGDFTTEITGAGTVTCGTLAVPGFNDTNFSFYPNPVKNVLNLSYDKEISGVEVFNLLGQKVISNKLNTNNAQIDMSNLANGAYMVKVTSDNQVKTVKVIKQ
ncbi:MAG: T9SS type A sorting domain-containing protein [Flavobacterium sp.]